MPACPDWDADDLLWHLGLVQCFWTTVIRDKLPGDEAQKRNPERPAGDRAVLLGFFRQVSGELAASLRATSPDTLAWTWSKEQTAGFVYRRQAHEALIHRTIRLRATDTGDSWLVRLARFTGTDPDGKSYDEPDIHVAESDPGGPARAEITGTAADLDCWLWHRPPFGPVEQSGDRDILDGLAKAIAPGVV